MGKVLYAGLLTFVLICTLTEEADEQNTIVSKRMHDVLPEEEQVEEKIENKGCLVDGQLYIHGKIFFRNQESSCIKYRCENGVARIIEEGCYYYKYQRCYPLGATLLHECHTYTCVKKSSDTKKGNTVLYRFRNTGPPRCKDYYGLCRLPGEKSSFKTNGQVYPNCVCRQVNTVMVKFDCKD